MAFFDDRNWLLSHVRNSFISSDGSGMCEAVILNDFPKDSEFFREMEMYREAEESDEDENESYISLEIHNDFDLLGHRLGNMTLQKDDKTEQEKKKPVQIKRVTWNKNQTELTEKEKGELFKRKEVKKVDKKRRSLLAFEIEKCPDSPKSLFSEYAKFDGSCHTGVPTRNYKIYLTMLPKPECKCPIDVSIISSAKVSDLIGLICWKYMTQNTNSNFKFRKSTDDYGLYIAEDDGEVDWDFSSLDPRETVGKFGLAFLAMVELSKKYVPREIKMEKTFSRMNSIDEDVERITEVADTEKVEKFNKEITAMEALLRQTFRVNMLHKMRGKTEVMLGISGDKIEVHPVIPPHARTRGKAWKQKSLECDIYLVVWCEILDLKSSGRAVFRIVHYVDHGDSSLASRHNPYKNNDFESEQEVAEEIVKNLNYILEIKGGIHQKEYLELKRKKIEKRSNFHIWPL